MSWNIKGAYVETCSCELMCPCTTSFDHGATYDYCRIRLVFGIRQGEVDGTDVGGLRIATIADIVSFGVTTGEPVRIQGTGHPVASDFTVSEAKRSRINAFGIEYEGKTGLSTSEFSWAA